MSKAKNSLIGSLLALILGVTGIINWWGDRGLVNYHNDFVQEAYSEVIMGSWIKLVETLNSEKTGDAEVMEILRNSLIPGARKWSQKGGSEQPPDYAASFYNRYTTALNNLSKSSEKLLKAFENKDSAEVEKALKNTGMIADGLNEMVLEFQEDLKKDRDFKFEDRK